MCSTYDLAEFMYLNRSGTYALLYLAYIKGLLTENRKKGRAATHYLNCRGKKVMLFFIVFETFLGNDTFEFSHFIQFLKACPKTDWNSAHDPG